MPNVELTHTVTSPDIAEWCDEDPKLIELILCALGPAAMQRAVVAMVDLVKQGGIETVECPWCKNRTWQGVRRCSYCSHTMETGADSNWSARDELRKAFQDDMPIAQA